MQHGFFWRPEEIDINKDRSDFKNLMPHEKHIFLKNLSYQILLDSVQSRSPNLALLPFISIPELEACVIAWTFFESIHARSYTHIIRNVVANPSEVFDNIVIDPHIVARAKSLTKYYDDFIEYGNYYQLLGEGTHVITSNNGETKVIELKKKELKKKLYLMLIAINILEGVRFYGSFATSWAFAENKKMEGNALIIKQICRDENIHLGITQNVLKFLPREDKDFIEIILECEAEVYVMFDIAVQQEKDFLVYLFKDGSILGLNETIGGSFIEYTANRRMKTLGLKQVYPTVKNPLTWTEHWITSDKVQVAPQETNITSYIVGGVSMDVTPETFKGFEII
jgi:ribonucleoside-diphosphate reductase beta chain